MRPSGYSLKDELAELPQSAPNVVPPKTTVYGQQCGANSDRIGAIEAGRLSLFIVAQADYIDLFGNPHRTQACGEVRWHGGDAASRTPVMICQGYNARYNCADHDCLNWVPDETSRTITDRTRNATVKVP